ncbi:carbohydrate ABC transporter permease [Candidatus Phytoplasma palmae]|uniref:ABC-type maltose transport system, permease protein n=1 Tax=Palm lethal yellowing phytoplasma TaxID=39646 RepID=B7TYM7_9MOLU|nr:ABC-type maltose transport system, permease protein [Palm lethal yellowing phytoplasma]
MNKNKLFFIKKFFYNFKMKIKIFNYLKFFQYLLLIFFAVFFIFPFYLMIVTSFKSIDDIAQNNALSLPKYGWHFSNYKKSFFDSFHFLKYFINTFRMSFFSSLLGTLCCILTSFALNILNFKYKKVIIMLLFLCLMMTSETLVLPNYRTVSSLNWIDTGKSNNIIFGTDYAMIFPYLVNVVHIFLLMKSFERVPKELYYTSKLDGITEWQYLWKILVPLTKPTIILIFIFRIVSAWTAYAWPELVGAKLLTNMMRKVFDSETGIDAVNIQMAASVLINLPLFFIFIYFKKYIVSGDQRSGIKG